MNADCKNINPLKRSGVNQQQRVLAALLPGFVKVDEREYPDLILFAKKYASHLNYFNKNNLKDGNWEPLMAMDVSVTLSLLIRLDIGEYFTYVKDIYDQILLTDLSQEADLKKYFKTLFDLCFSISRLLNRYYLDLPNDFEFKEVLGNAVRSSLPEYYNRLMEYYDEAITQNIIDPAGDFFFDDRPDGLILSQNFDKSLLADIWTDATIPTFEATYNGTTVALKIKNTASHNLFTGIVDGYLKVLAQITDSASGYLNHTLQNFPTHSPHYTLYLAFIKLFRHSQNHLNGFTARHLDLYYKDILRLNKKLPEPDHAHLTFELAKTAPDAYLLKKGTVFKAGKDVDGLEIFYDLKDDVVLGKAKVAALKNIFVSKNISGGNSRVTAGASANSEDGIGAELTSADKSWLPFGNAGRSMGQTGFGIASSYLFLQEGVREVTFKFYAPENETIGFNVDVLKNRFALRLSAEKGWLEVPVNNGDISIDGTKEFFSIKIKLDGGDPPIVPYSSKIHGYTFDHALPMALFTLKNAEAQQVLWDFEFSKIGIGLAVSGIKSLAIENDEGTLNSAKPFDLFGASPHVGSSFIVGCKELFMKTGQPGDVTVDLKLTWDNFDELTASWDDNTYRTAAYQLIKDENVVKETSFKKSIADQFQGNKIIVEENARALENIEYGRTNGTKNLDSFNLDIVYLEDAEWKDKDAPMEDHLFEKSGTNPDKNSTIHFGLSGPLDVIADYSLNENYSSKSKWGFFKLKLNNDFGHSSYAKDLADAAKDAKITSTKTDENTTTTTININDVPEPYTPKVKEISLDYTASTELAFAENSEERIVQLGPFGNKDISSGPLPKNLLPQFNDEGELFIGFEGLQTNQTLSVLFQLAEGTADPLTEKQEVKWHYLGVDNVWKAFEKEEISDGTNGLIKSGITTFSISNKASAKNTLMGEQFHWLKASVAQNTPAICKLIDIVAQAGLVRFYDYGNIGNYFKNTLPATAISKLVFSDSALKKIEQTYASIGGRTRESDASYYRRVSERLRHKQRAVAMWDYERLVLEEFPDIFKVKCINHMQIIEKKNGAISYIDNELKPGHVLVISVPDLHNKNAFDPLRPYTGLGRLQDIKKYLSDKVSPHLALDVRNPRFEEIQLEFKVQYLTDDFALYTKQLKTELEQFMAPWAFDPDSNIEFGSKISKSVLIDFMEERPYVDTLSCVKMYCINENGRSNDLGEAIASSARSVFVSVKSGDPIYAHIIQEKSGIC